MEINKTSLPHPIVAPGSDDVMDSFETEFERDLYIDFIVIRVKQKTSNKTINTLLKNGKARFCVAVNCPTTLFRKNYYTDTDNEINISSDLLRDRVEVEFYVYATNSIKAYRPENINDDYENSTFDVFPGDVLGYGGRVIFWAEKKWKEMERVSSILMVKPREENHGPMLYYLQNEKIIIFLSKTDFENFNKIDYEDDLEIQRILHGAIVFPAFTYALTIMLDADNPLNDDLKDYKWYKIFKTRMETTYKLNDFEMSREDAPVVAQILLEDQAGKTLPIERTLQCMLDAQKSSYNDDTNEE